MDLDLDLENYVAGSKISINETEERVEHIISSTSNETHPMHHCSVTKLSVNSTIDAAIGVA